MRAYDKLDKQRDVLYKKMKSIEPTRRIIETFPLNTKTGKPFTRPQWMKKRTGLMIKVDRIDNKIWKLLHNGQPLPTYARFKRRRMA